MGDGRETAARVQPQSEGLDFGSAGFDLGIGGGFALSQGLDAACCPKIPDSVASEANASYSAQNAAPIAPVQIQVATLAEVRAAVVANETREVKQTPQVIEVPVPIAPASPEIKSSPAVAEVGAIDYGSVSFDFGGVSGDGTAAGLGFSLSESLTADCCAEPVVTTTASGLEKVEKKAVQIQEKSLDEVKATALANDSRDISQVHQAKEVAPPVAEQRSNVSAPQPQERVETNNSAASANSAVLRTESNSGNAMPKAAVVDRVRDTPKASSSDVLQVREKQSRDVSSARGVAPGVDKQERLSSAIPVATETTVISGKAKSAAPGLNEILGEKAQRTSEIKSENISRRDKAPADNHYSPREIQTVTALEGGNRDSFEQRFNARAGASFSSVELARPAERVERERNPTISRSYSQADTALKGETRIQSGYGTERISASIRERTLPSAKSGENIAVNSKEPPQVAIANSRSSLQRVVDGIRNIPGFLKGERAQEKTMVLRLSNVTGREGAAERAVESKGIVQSAKEYVLAFKERVAEKLAQVAERVANLPGFRNVVAFAQRMSELIQRIPMPERLQNLLRTLRGKAKDEPAYVMKLSLNAANDVPHPKEPIIRRISNFVKQHVIEVVSNQIQKLSNLPGVKQVLSSAKRTVQFVARSQRHGRIEKGEHKSEGIRVDKHRSEAVVSPQRSLRTRIRSYLNSLQRGKNSETVMKLEKRPSIGRKGPQKETSSQIRNRRTRHHGKEHQNASPDQVRKVSPIAPKTRMARNLSLAVSLSRGRIRPNEKREIVRNPKAEKLEVRGQKSIKEMRAVPLKKLNSESFITRQTKRGNLLLLNRLRRRGIRGSRQLKKYLDPRSLLYRRLMRELSLDELEKFLKGMAAQKTRGLAREYYLEPRKKRRRQSATQRV